MLKLITQIIDDILWPAVFLVFFWLVFFANLAYPLDLNYYGVHPHSLFGLIGIIAMPFLHGDFTHLFSNSIPFLVSASFIFHFFKQRSWRIFIGIWLISGLGIWLMGEERSIHIGASGLVYGMVAFLMTSGFIRKNKHLTAVAFILVFMYGSMVWGLFPQYSWVKEMNISWEGHLFGALSGVGLAFIYRKHGPEDDKDPFEENDEMPQWWIDMENEKRMMEELQAQQNQNPEIRITYKPSDKSTSGE